MRLDRAIASAASISVARCCGYRWAPRPLVMVWEATHRCNAACSYCYVPAHAPAGEPALSTSEVGSLLEQARGLGLACLVVSGGEPLLREDLAEVIARARSLGLIVSLTTNGTCFDARTLPILLSCDHVTISAETTDRATYERRRGLDRFDEVLAGIDRLQTPARRPRLHVQSVIDGSNWREVRRIQRFFHGRGVDTTFQLLYGRRFEIDPAEWARQINGLRYHDPRLGRLMHRFLRLFPEVAAGRRRSPCLALSANFVVTPSGALLACSFRRESLAELRREPLREAWRRLREPRRIMSGEERACTCANTCFTLPAMVLS